MLYHPPAPCQGSSFQLSDLTDPGVYKPLAIGFMLMVFQQMTGINAIMFYAENIFEQAHFKVRGLCYCRFFQRLGHMRLEGAAVNVLLLSRRATWPQ